MGRMHNDFARMAGAAHTLASRASPLMRLSPRDGLSKGGIAGAVIGSVVGAILIFLLFLPFVLRALRERRQRTEFQDPFQAEEMGQSPGGPFTTTTTNLQRPHPADSSRNISAAGRHFMTHVFHPAKAGPFVNGSPAMNGYGVDQGHPQSSPLSQQQPQQLKEASGPKEQPPSHPQGVSIVQGLPSPVSPPLSGAEFPPASSVVPAGHTQPGQDASGSFTAQPPSGTTSPAPWHQQSVGTVGRQSSRDLSFSSTSGPPSRQLTGFTSLDLVQEPQQYEPGQQAPHHRSRIHLPHLPESVQRFIHPRRRDPSVRTSSGLASESLRSPSLGPGDSLYHTESAPPEIVDTEAPGEAWSYFHPDPPAATSSSAPARPTIVPISRSAGVEPISPVSPNFQRGDGLGELPTSTTGKQFVEEPEAISPFTDKTVSPKEGMRFFKTKTPSFFSKRLKGVQRMDSLGPQDIVSDIPSPPAQPSQASFNPMELMKPTTDTEHHWMVNQEIHKMENSPPPQPMDTTPTPPAPEEIATPPGTDDSPEMTMVMEEEPQMVMEEGPQMMVEEPTQQASPPMKYEPEPAPVAQEIFMNATGYPIGTLEPGGPSPHPMTFATPPPTEPSMANTPSIPSIGNTPSTAITELDPPYENMMPKSEEEIRQMFPQWPDETMWGQQLPYDTLVPGIFVDTNNMPNVLPPPGAIPKALVCDECGRTFDLVHKLNHHKRYHERPHVCTHAGCEMRFGTKTHLHRHINDKHNRARKYYCMVQECPFSRKGGKSFPRKDNWRRHMLNKHQITPDTDPGAEFVDEIMGGTGV